MGAQLERDVLANVERAIMRLRDAAERAANQALTLVPAPDGGYVQRRPERERTADEMRAESALWAWWTALPALEQVRVYHAGIVSGDRQLVEAIERLTRAMQTLSVEDMSKGKALKREHWIAADHREAIEKLERTANAFEVVKDRARRLVREVAGWGNRRGAPAPRSRRTLNVGNGPAGGRILVHLGDASASEMNFGRLAQAGSADVALVPFWWLLDEGGIAFLRNRWKPKHVVAFHIGADDAPSVARIRREDPDAWICTRQGESRTY